MKHNRNEFRGSEAEQRAAALVTMMYVTYSIANAYKEEADEILADYNLYTFDTKAEGERLKKRFDEYHNCVRKYYQGEPMAQSQVIAMYELIKGAIDEQVEESIKQYREKWVENSGV